MDTLCQLDVWTDIVGVQKIVLTSITYYEWRLADMFTFEFVTPANDNPYILSCRLRQLYPLGLVLVYCKRMLTLYQKADDKIFVCKFSKTFWSKLYHIENSKIRGQTA